MKWFILITWQPQPVIQGLTTCNQASPGTVPVAVWTRSFYLTGRERFAAGRFLARVDANRTLAPSTLESGSRPEQVWTQPYSRSCPERFTSIWRGSGTRKCLQPVRWLIHFHQHDAKSIRHERFADSGPEPFNCISITRGGRGIGFPGKKHYITLEWPING